MKPCVETDKPRTYQGYGREDIVVEGAVLHTFAHRAAWIRAYGPIPDRMVVMHLCDNPPCVEIEHLRLGTRAENNADMRGKGRQARGEKNHTARLTEGQVRAIRLCWERGETASSLARVYGVATQTVDDIVHRRTWIHVA